MEYLCYYFYIILLKGEIHMYKSPDGWMQYTETWSVQTLMNMIGRGQLLFDWDKQRGYMWNNVRASLFIHSIFWGMLENTETFRFAKHGNQYLCTDGKQRGLTLIKYINNEYALTGLKNSFPIYLSDGTIFSINGKRFKQLPPELQEKILNLQINVAILDNASPDIEAEMFARMNNGMSVSRTDIAICRNDSSEIIDELGKHELFKVMLGDKGIEAKKFRAVIIKTWESLATETPNFASKYLHSLEATISLTDDEKNSLTELYDTLINIYKNLILIDGNIGKKMFDNQFMYYYIPLLDMFEDNHSKAAKWMNGFYKNVPQEYTQITGFAHDAVNTENKMNIIKQSIEKFLKDNPNTADNIQLTLE